MTNMPTKNFPEMPSGSPIAQFELLDNVVMVSMCENQIRLRKVLMKFFYRSSLVECSE